jgi:hypothetical protein
MLLVIPAHTAAANPTLPAGETMYEVSCDSSTNADQLHSLNIEAGTRTPIGDGVPPGGTGSGCASQGAVKPGTDWYYYTDGHSDGLFRVNLISGDVELVGQIMKDGSPVMLSSMAIDGSGNAYGLTRYNLYSLNLSTATLSDEKPADIVALTGGSPGAFAYDEVTDKFYVVENYGGLYRLDVATGELTLLVTNPDFWVASMAFDSRGRIWVNSEGLGVTSVNLADFGITARWSDWHVLSPEVYSNSLAIRRTQTSNNENLANTGAVEIAPLVIGGLGAAVLAFAFRRRSA